LARTVLLADDSVTAQNMGRRILMDAGYEVITVNNGSAALKKIHENRPDLIVLDVYMPGYGGLEVCQRLKESGETMQIPVLLTVGKMEPFKADEARKVRADGHIVKPFEASELLAALARLEDRIVPQATAPRGRNGKSTEKKSRFWYAEDPVANLADIPSDKVAHLADVRKRQTESSVAETAKSNESTPPVVAEIPVESASASSQDQPKEDQPISEVKITEPAAEFPVTAEPPAVEETESTVEVAKIEIAPIETATIEIASIETGKAEEIAPAPASEAAAAVTGEATTRDVASGATHWVAENVPLTAAEALIALDQEMHEAQAASPKISSIEAEARTHEQAASCEVLEDSPHPSSLPVASLQSLEKEDGNQVAAGDAATTNTSVAAFAAAASVSSAVSTQHLAPGVQPLDQVAENAIPDQDTEPPVPSEAAAAWENWRQIRESVMNGEKTTAIAEAAAGIIQVTASAHQSSAELSSVAPSSPSTPGSEASSLSSIVDSVLAELKPKLMEEIAKKLSAEKK
jgi:CheY-like chemotaxis protein